MKIRKCHLPLVLALLLLPGAGSSPAAGPETGGRERFTVDFTDVDIRKVIETVSEATGQNFLVDDRIQGRVTVIGPKSLTSEELYQVFLSILQVKGFAMVPSGKVNKVVPSANVGSFGLDTKVGQVEEIPGTDRYITQVIPVRYASADDVRNLIQPLVPKTDSLTVYAPTNLLILTTTESLIARLSQIIAVVDVPGSREEIRIIPVLHSPVEDLAQKITKVLESQSSQLAAVHRAVRPTQPGEAAPSSRAETKIIPDTRTNSLIAIGDQQTLDKVAELVKRLDVPAPQGGGKVRVYYLQNADGSELAKVLSGIPVEAARAEPPGPTPGSAPQAQPQRAPAAKAGEISIIADPSTNALVITCTPEEYEVLEGIIRSLDVPREQVLVEVLIAEVSFTKTMELGVEWRTADNIDGKGIGFAGSSFGTFDEAVVALPSLPSGLVIGAVGQTITFGDLEFPNLGALIRALKTDSEVNILSTPTIVTTDNQQAEIVVGQTVPFQTSQKYDSNNQPVITYDYRDVGLTLKITPQINTDRFVKLKIFSQLEALVESQTGVATLAPTTLKRKADTSVVVKDGSTVVIGGLIREDKTKSASKVPLLGDIPLLGALFRSTNTRTEKTNLLIFLTPHIMTTPEEMREVTRERVERTGSLKPDQLEGLELDVAPAPAGTAPTGPGPGQGGNPEAPSP